MSEKLFTEQEYEVICLKAAIDSIDSILNHKVLELRGNDPDAEIYFHTETHQKYFYIIVLDFLSKTEQILTGENVSCLELIKNIKESPNFNTDNSISELTAAINTFYSWINEEITVEVWLPSIEKQCNVKLKREEFIRICGNISKHNFTRLTIVSKEIREILKKRQIDISFHDSLLILNDFYERFHEDILIYHGSNIAEMLNNIRWGIHEYLLPEFNRSYRKDESDPRGLRYSYTYPENIKAEFAKNCYWGLMNSVRAKPNLKRFKSTKWLKLRY